MRSRAIAFVKAWGRARGVQYASQGAIATPDGESLWGFRFSSEGKSRSLFLTRDVCALRQQYPDREIVREVSDDARLGFPSRAGTCLAPGSRCPKPATAWPARQAISSCPSPQAPQQAVQKIVSGLAAGIPAMGLGSGQP